VDHLLGLKENVIIGKLIPARASIVVEVPPKPILLRLPPQLTGGDGETPSPARLVEEVGAIVEETAKEEKLGEDKLSEDGKGQEEESGQGEPTAEKEKDTNAEEQK
jgi:hypothetical protein